MIVDCSGAPESSFQIQKRHKKRAVSATIEDTLPSFCVSFGLGESSLANGSAFQWTFFKSNLNKQGAGQCFVSIDCSLSSSIASAGTPGKNIHDNHNPARQNNTLHKGREKKKTCGSEWWPRQV